MRAIALLLLAATGCTTLGGARPQLAGAPPPSDRCATLDDRHTLYGGLGAFGGALAGGAGLSTVATEDKGLRTGLAIGAVVAGAISVGAALVSQNAAAAYVRECK
jgi:hypothetical protein